MIKRSIKSIRVRKSATQSQVADINKTNQTVDEDEKKLSATDEIAKTADTAAKGAMAKSNQNTKDISDLRSVIANIDDYKPAGEPVVVHFASEQGHAHEGREGEVGPVATQVSVQSALLHHRRGIYGPDRNRGA